MQRGIQYLARYEWEGEPHNSPSVKRDSTGKIVARNLFANPSYEIGTNNLTFGTATTGYTTSSESIAGEHSLIIAWKEAGVSNAYVQQVVDVSPDDAGRWIAFSEQTRKAATPDDLYKRAWVGFRDASGALMSNTFLTTHIVTNNGLASQTRQGYAAQIPVGTASIHLRIRFNANSDGTGAAPDGFARTDAWIADVADTESEALAQVSTYFDGDTPDVVDEGSREGSFSFPFFPVFLADSTVQGEHELRVEGDAPVWPVWEIVGPGRDVEIVGPDGSRLFVEGEVTSPITIVTEPGKRSIRDASGLIWERMKPGDDQFFALEPGEQTVKMTMVGGNPESTIKAVYSENWKTPRGTAQGMIRGGAV